MKLEEIKRLGGTISSFLLGFSLSWLGYIIGKWPGFICGGLLSFAIVTIKHEIFLEIYLNNKSKKKKK